MFPILLEANHPETYGEVSHSDQIFFLTYSISSLETRGTAGFKHPMVAAFTVCVCDKQKSTGHFAVQNVMLARRRETVMKFQHC